MGRARQRLRAIGQAPASAPIWKRAAIYCRKSVLPAIEQDFSSIDNQRERGEAFVTSQGWHLIPTTYADAGLSGGNTERPALQQLLQDAEAGYVDVIVVYKLDRLSRSLLDFLQIHRFLERLGVSIISVTEPIDTSTPMGRGFVNVLLSFAQMEREVAAERTRDKIEAARRRGQWTGGRPVLGYDSVDGKLIVNKDEADQVVTIFELYDADPSLTNVVRKLNRRGWTQKLWTTKTGHECGGSPWNRASLRTLLTNPLYAGHQRLGGETFKGEHERIVPKRLWDRVQQLLDGRPTRRSTSNGAGYLLRGLFRCAACDSAMTPHGTKRKGRSYRYYTCSRSQKSGDGTCPTPSVQATRVEKFVIDQIRHIGADPNLQEETFRQAIAQVKAQRRGLRAEAKRIERDLVTVRADVERLVGGLTRATGPAADAVAAELGRAQERLATLEARQVEVREQIATLKAQEIDREELAIALQEFDPIWDALLTPERERVMKLLIDRIDYNGEAGRMEIRWRLAGFGQLADEIVS